MNKTRRCLHDYRIACATLIALTGITVGAAAGAADGEQYLQAHCAGCHTLGAPNVAQLAATERAERKAPQLHYAGNKFRKDWLRAWLVAPTRIRPGGSFPPDHTVVTDEGDVIDTATLADHPAVPADSVDAVIASLMSRRLQDPPTLAEPYVPKAGTLMLGRMDFNKFKGCGACHRDATDSGGLSGPELYTAWQRLQADFIVSYTADPIAWDPHSMMPNRHLKESDIHKLADYLKLVAEQQQ
jgi:mono/diheme cytochrome c family protein